MKKFALGILSVFMILGGVLLSACEKKVSLSVSTEEVVIFTNDEQEENYQQKEIDVFLEDSNAGIIVEVLKGEDCVTYSNVRKKGDGNFSFTIFGNKSGDAEVKVSAVEDIKQSKTISVSVKTIIESISKKTGDNQDARTDLFVVKGSPKALDFANYFEFSPVTANVCDIVWTFEETGTQEFLRNDKLAAKIENQTLYVYDNFDLAKLQLRASFVRNPSIHDSVTFDVIENSTINNLVIEDMVLYQNDTPATKQVEFDLKRNDANKSSVSGVLVVNTPYQIDLEVEVYEKLNNGTRRFLDRKEYEEYFSLDIISNSQDENRRTYNFVIESLDTANLLKFGDLYFYFKVSYHDFSYDILSDDVEVLIRTAYSATRIDLYDEDKNSLNNAQIDVFSDYAIGNGFKVNTVVGPENVSIDNNMFFVSIDLNQSNLRNLSLTGVEDLIKVFCRGQELVFRPSEPGSSVYVSDNIQSGTDIYLASSTRFDALEYVEIKFVSVSSANANTTINVNLYKISTAENLIITTVDGDEIPKVSYMSSNVTAVRSLDFTVKIKDMTTLSGLSLVSSENERFEFSALTLVSSNLEGENFVVANFSVSLNGANFSDKTSFWFEHITGKKSQVYELQAFVPMQSVSIQNGDKSSADVFKEESSVQGFVNKDGLILFDENRQSSSLSKLLLEAGTSLPLITDYQNATLSETGVIYRYLSFENFVSAIKITNGITDNQEALKLANQLYSENNLNVIAEYYRYFENLDGNLFRLSNSRLALSDNSFKGYVCVLYSGFNEQHENITLARLFALESFYSTRYLSSNVQTTLLYTTETLSVNDISKSRVDVTISMRPDEKVPTYSNVLSYFNFESAIEDFVQISEDGTSLKNSFYTLSDLSFANQGRFLKFRITANSTNLQTSVRDILSITYLDENGIRRETEIQIEIRNVKRVESVEWLNRTLDNEIYLNLTTSVSSERNFTISTSVMPSEANDLGLSYSYFAIDGSSNDLSITTSQVGQTFNLSINTDRGGYGYLYLLPNDMIKMVDGVRQVLVYKYDVDESGNTIETPSYIRLSNAEWNLRYDEIINGSENISNYFLNNDGEKIYYRDVILRILVTIADGSSEGTAIRVYNQSDLEQIDSAKYYKIMNNITFSNWKAYDIFSGMIFGKDESITLTFENGSENFINRLNGTVKDLIFAGEVNSANNLSGGFIANTNNGLISNCSVDVYYKNGEYRSSVINANATSAVGAVAGINNGQIENINVYGASIIAEKSSYVGGIVGQNFGKVSSSGFEFYNFVNKDGGEYSNTIVAGGTVGGIVGFAGVNSVVERSYVYAYSLTNENSNYETIISNGNFATGVFAGGHADGARFVESFGFMGDLHSPMNSSTSNTLANFENCYMTYYLNGEIRSRIFKNVQIAFVNDVYFGSQISDSELLRSEDIPNSTNQNGSQKWQNLVLSLNKDIWETENIEIQNNFGFVHLKNVAQSASVNLSDVEVQNNLDPLKALKVGQDKGILFIYKTQTTVSDAVERANLDSLNTISVADLFGIKPKEARSLLLTSDSRSISISANSIKILSKNVEEFEIKVHSKMNFTEFKTFSFIVLNRLPNLSTTLNGVELKDNQIVLIQSGKSRSITYNFNNSIFLGNNVTPYALERDDYSIEYSLTDNKNSEDRDYISVSKSNNSLVIQGRNSHVNNNVTNLESYVTVESVDNQAFANAIKDQFVRNFSVSVYNGATALAVNNANNLVIKPSQYAVFDVSMTTDNVEDDLVFGLKYGEIDLPVETINGNNVSFVVDSKLTLEISWTKKYLGVKDYRFNVLVKIKDSQKHLLDKNYDNLILSVNASSQTSNQNYVKTVGLSVQIQNVEDISISTYNVANRQIRNSVLYITPSDEITNTLAPSSDAIVAVTVSPAYAKMTHFTLTYSTTGTGEVGTVNISRLSYNSSFGYYVNPASTSLIENGIRVNLTENDRTGAGVFYFRLYISSAFASTSGLRLTLTYYDENETLISGTHNLSVDYLQDANIKVNGVSTYVLSKGETAEVSVTLSLDQNLYELYLQNNGSNISLSTPTVEIFNNYKVYTASVTTYVDATLDGGKSSGIFYVCASVERTLNNVQEIKVSRATLCLVDFSINADKVSVKGSGATRTYNGKTYDVYYSYLNETSILNFNYSMNPENYVYDSNNLSEVAAVEELIAKRNQFALNNNYRDDEVGYYINYRLNENDGRYHELSLKQQLWYAASESNSTAIYNENYQTFLTNDMFEFNEHEVGEYAGCLTITGKRSGVQLMKLQTIVVYQGIEFVYDYYFLIAVEIWSDEETPTQISSAQEFIDLTTKSAEPDDYILMNDIVFEDYTPIDTDLIKSLDGNGFTIHLNSFAMSTGNNLNLALFNTVSADTTLKNVRVNVYNGGQITVNIDQYKTINVAGFAITNNGVIYNCEVVSYYDSNYQKHTVSGDNGLVVKYTKGSNSDPIELTSAMSIESSVAGFVITNNASIMNSRVGGTEFKHIVDIAGVKYITSETLGKFVIDGQVEVSGFVNSNEGTGYISASFAKNVQIYNRMNSNVSLTAGFVLRNANNIQNSYVEGMRSNDDEEIYSNLSNISSLGVVAGFVYENNSLIKNSYSNIAIENNALKSSMVAGFVYINRENAEVSLCFSACEILKTDINQMHFSGIDDFANSLNYGQISVSYFYNETRVDDTNQSKVTKGALAIHEIKQDTFYGFSFASSEDSYDGIWMMTNHGISLVSANQIALSNRYAVTNGRITSLFYNRNILNVDTMAMVDLSYGGENNPIIIRNARDFAMATGKATTNEISSYKEYYNDKKVFGNYRFVNDVDMSEIDQNSENDNSVKLQTTEKTFEGLIDGNGFTISNINLGSSKPLENYGLFAKLDGAVIMNLDLVVDSIHNAQANIVGTLAGTAIDTRILAISLSPVSSETNTDNTAVHGNNIVGGVVGMLFGESRLSDITVKDIDIYSSYYSNSKDIYTNSKYVGNKLRQVAEDRVSLSSSISTLSYAGAVAGYVDIYDDLNSEYVKYLTTLQVSDYNIVTVHVLDAVNIYGEVAGGLFGYVGNSTLIYDANIKLDADMNLSKPSYITSKNLYAGGLIGENYGGLFAVSASYSESLQDTIESGENAYYNGTLSAEKGQLSIFSYTNQDAGFATNTNDPMFVGGLVGYMGGGYIYIGYNKLNVVSHSDKTVAVGGIIGIAGYTDDKFDLTFLTNTPKVNILLNDVYASGDVYVDGQNGVASGIIGALEGKTLQGNQNNMSAVGFKNVMATNYYSYDGAKLAGDKAVLNDQSYLSDRHFMLVGQIYSKDTSAEKKLISDLLIIDSDDNYFNVRTSEKVGGETSSLTVGGYAEVKVGEVSLKINPFGFDKENAKYYTDSRLLLAENIGNKSMSTPETSYARMYSYFLGNGWSEEFWSHEQNNLFPEIELLPKLNVLYWDAYNTEEVLRAMKNSGITVVLRGKVNNSENDLNYTDIDLTSVKETEDLKTTIEGFRGHLVSYADYMYTETEGNITQGNDKPFGGSVGDRVGIILDKPLFKTLEPGAEIEGINFYINQEENSFESIVESYTNLAVFRKTNIILNKETVVDTKLSTRNSESAYSAGLISAYAYSSSIIDTKVVLREGSSLTFNYTGNSSNSNVYMGILAGYVRQESGYTSISVQNLELTKESAEDENNDKVTINYNGTNRYKEMNIGLYAGAILKGDGTPARISISMATLNNVEMGLDVESTDNDSSVNVGGYVGSINSIDSMDFSFKENETDQEDGILISQNSSLKKLNAGLLFGKMENSYFSTSNTRAKKLYGKIYQSSGASTKEAKIGGVAGELSSGASVRNISVDLKVGKLKGNDEHTYTRDEVNGIINIFDENKYTYDLSPYIIADGTDNAIGGFFGNVSGRVTVNGTCDISGIIDVQVGENAVTTDENPVTDSSKVISVGGMIGRSTSNFVVNASSSKNTINMAVKGNATANVGGIVGNAVSVTDTSTGTTDLNSSISGISVTGTLLSDVKTLKFGGAIGYFGRKDYTDSNKGLTISNIVYGGAVKVYGDNNNNGSVSAGGIVGEFDILNTTEPDNAITRTYSISNCLSYGDVFVNYLPHDETGYIDQKLSQYSFGGIVGIGTYINVNNCVSMMTNFNNRLANEVSGENRTGIGSVGAIVGRNDDCVKYVGNYYSSGVCLAYQEQSGNQDLSYNENNGNFLGYTSIVKAGEERLPAGGNILSHAESYVYINGFEEGHKLRPYKWESKDIDKALDSSEEAQKVTITGNFNNIKWISLTDDLEIENPIANKLTDTVFVGNGHTLTRTDTNEHTVIAGGIVNSMGEAFDTTQENNIPNFNAITSLVVKLDVMADIKSGSIGYGGVAGNVTGNSFIYAVGVTGELSVGNEADVQLGGVAGMMEYGYIDECYVDAEISYRGTKNGCVSGIANLGGHNTTIKNTYSSGMITTYVDNQVYTLAQATSGNQNSVVDCYSNTQIKRFNILSENEAKSVSDKLKNHFISNEVVVIGNVYNGSYDVIEELKDIDSVSVGYSDEKVGRNSIYAKGNDNSSFTTWYFSPFTNNGYATHGFGYLKNVTTYTRSALKDVEDNVVEYKDGKYEYTAVSYQDIINNDKSASEDLSQNKNDSWYLSVLNTGKLTQMLEIGNSASNFKFVLKYSFNVSSDNIGSDITLDFDGNGNTLDFENLNNLSSGLFGEVTGNIDNLRLTNMNVTGTAGLNNVGLLAEKVTGNISNITITGELTPNGASNEYVGGVVGELEGNASGIDAVVNITTSQAGTIVGGVVGYMHGKINDNGTINLDKISEMKYSSNSGMIVNSSTSDKTTGLAVTVYKQSNNDTNDSVNISNVVGGLVGYAQGVNVSNSYNANAVLSGFTTKSSVPYLAGGVVGYAQNTTISSSYNTGFVGAGNYSNSLYSLAGGIFGYGHGVTVENCINDGAVQAIGSDSNIKQEISDPKIISGEQSVTDYTLTPNELKYEVTSTYSNSFYRQVYAYGIGYAGAGNNDFTGNSTSLRNIKNDGNMGEFKDTVTITFDRQKILDNDDGNFYGSFSSNSEVKVNGLDSYGLTQRIYMTDKITRTYGNPESEGNINDIEKNVKDYLSTDIGIFDDSSTLYYNNFSAIYNNTQNGFSREENKNSLKSLSLLGLGISGKNFVESGVFTSKEEFALSGTSTYASSAEFVGYDALVHDENGTYFGLIGYNASATSNNEKVLKSNELDSTLDAINSSISKINENRDKSKNSSLKTMVVNGQSVAIIYTSDQLKAIYAPHKVEATVSFARIDNIEDINEITNRNFSVVDVKMTNGDGTVSSVSPQYYNIENIDRVNKTVSINMYFDKEIKDGEVSVSLTYTTTPKPVVLTRQNVIYYDGDIGEDGAINNKGVYILLKKGSQSLVDYDIVDILESQGGVENNDEEMIEYSWSASLGDMSIDEADGWKIGYSAENDCAYLYNSKLTSLEDLSGELRFTLTTKTTEISYIEETLSLENKKVEKEISSIQFIDGPTVKFNGFEKTIIGNKLIDFVDVNSADNVYGKKIALTELENSEKVAFGSSDGKYSFGFEKVSGWNFVDNDLDGYKVSIKTEEGVNYLYIEKAEIQDGQEIIKPDVVWAENDDDWLNENFDKFDLYLLKNSGNSTSDNSGLFENRSINQTEDSIRFRIDYNLQAQGQFNEKGEFTGDNFENVSANDYIEKLEEEYFGIKFVALNVKYQYKASKINLTSLSDLGYELKILDSEGGIKDFKLGSSESNQAFGHIDLENYAESDRIEISYNLILRLPDNQEFDIDNDRISIDFPTVEENNTQINRQYTIEKGKEEVISGAVGGLISEQIYVSTQMNKTTQNQNNSYDYRVYQNGVVSIQLIDSDEETIKYIFDFENGKTYEVAFDNGKWNYDEAKEITGLDFNKLIDERIDLIVKDFDKNSVMFIRNRIGDFPVRIIEKGNSQTVEKAEDLKLFNESGSTITVEDENYIEGSFRISLDGENWNSVSGVESEDGFVFNVDNLQLGETNLQYKYKTSKIITKESLNSEKTTTSAANIVILAGDCKLGEIGFNGNNKVILGENYSIKFIKDNSDTEKVSLFKTNSSYIEKVCVIGVVSLENFENAGNYSLLTEKNDSYIEKISMFGNIRNINNELSGDINIGLKTTSDIGNVDSSISINGLDGISDSVKINCNIQDKIIIDTQSSDTQYAYNSKNLIIAGNGGNGINGISSFNGGDAKNGGNGGSVEVDDSFSGYVRAGVAGVGGYGGNGQNGYFTGMRTIGGGKAGKFGSNGVDGTVTGTTKVIQTKGKTTVKNYSGNSGIGGFGHIIGNTLYTSAEAGTAEKAGADGYRLTWKSTRSNDVAFGEAKNLQVYNGKCEFPGHSWGDPSYDNYIRDLWLPNIDNDMKTKGSKEIAAEKIYYSEQNIYYSDVFFWRWGNLYKGRYKKVIWTSGENINSGGNFVAGIQAS